MNIFKSIFLIVSVSLCFRYEAGGSFLILTGSLRGGRGRCSVVPRHTALCCTIYCGRAGLIDPFWIVNVHHSRDLLKLYDWLLRITWHVNVVIETDSTHTAISLSRCWKQALPDICWWAGLAVRAVRGLAEDGSSGLSCDWSEVQSAVVSQTEAPPPGSDCGLLRDRDQNPTLRVITDQLETRQWSGDRSGVID